MNRKPTVRCPRCHQPVVWEPETPHKPFCSERCKLIDLGKWANDEHAIPGEPLALNLNEEDHLEN